VFPQRTDPKRQRGFFFVASACAYLRERPISCFTDKQRFAQIILRSEKLEVVWRKIRPRIKCSKGHASYLSLSLSSLLRERSLFSGSRSRSLSLSWFVTEELRSESVGLGHCGGVGKDGGVRWSLFHGSWGLLKFCRFGPSL